MKRIGVFACLLLVMTSVYGKTAEEWKSRVIYQILTDRFAKETDPATDCSDLTTYCGGTFRGILNKLDYIQGMGFNAVWFSSFVEQTPNGYHGYWHRNLDNTNGQFGSSEDLKELVNECHNRGIWVMLDVVPNHMGNQVEGDWENFQDFYPFDKEEYYHSYCNIDFDNNPSQTEKEVCRLANLPDLDQSHEFVRTTLKNWVKNTVSEYRFDGIRCDAVPHIAKDFWEEYAEAAGVYQIGEVFHDDASYVAGYQGPLDALLNFPMFYKLENAFQKRQTMRNLHDGFEANRAAFSDISVLGNFLDNHDTARFLSQNNDWSTLKNALAYIVFAEGIPVMYYGTEQAFAGSNDPKNRESLWPHYDTSHMIYQYIGQIVKFRNQQGPAMYYMKQIERYVDDQFFAFTRSYVFVATTNIGSGQSLSRTITYHPYTDGTKLVNLLDKSDIVTVSGGSFPVNIENGQPKIYFPQDMDPSTGGDGYCLIPGTCG